LLGAPKERKEHKEKELARRDKSQLLSSGSSGSRTVNLRSDSSPGDRAEIDSFSFLAFFALSCGNSVLSVVTIVILKKWAAYACTLGNKNSSGC
jgi:hypothetical protein